MKIEEIKKMLKELISRKHIANIMVLLAVAIIALIFTSDFFSKDTQKEKKAQQTSGDIFIEAGNNMHKSEEEIIEARLKGILENIKGSGKVEVMVTFEMGSEIVPASNKTEVKDTSEEKDSNGGLRTVVSENVMENIVITSESGGNKALVLKEIKPQVRGVIVVAEGADDVQVKTVLYDAVKTVLNIPGNRVQIYSKN